MKITQMWIGDTDCHLGVFGGHFPHNLKEESKTLLPSIGVVTGDHRGGSPRNKLTPIPMAPVPMLDGGGSLGEFTLPPIEKGAEQALDGGGT